MCAPWGKRKFCRITGGRYVLVFSRMSSKISSWRDKTSGWHCNKPVWYLVHKAHPLVISAVSKGAHCSWCSRAVGLTLGSLQVRLKTTLAARLLTFSSRTLSFCRWGSQTMEQYSMPERVRDLRDWDWLTETSLFNTTWHYTDAWYQTYMTVLMYYSKLTWYQILACMLGDLS